MPETLTSDGLKVHDLPNVGLVVSAAEHNRKMAKARDALEMNAVRWEELAAFLLNTNGSATQQVSAKLNGESARDALAELGG